MPKVKPEPEAKKEKRKVGRPEVEIDVKALNKLLEMQATLAECAAFLDVSEDSLERFCKKHYDMTFLQYRDIKRQAGFISLRRKQWQLAEKNATMAIFLGKQYLGQRDVQEVKATVGAEIPQLQEMTTEELKEILGEAPDDAIDDGTKKLS